MALQRDRAYRVVCSKLLLSVSQSVLGGGSSSEKLALFLVPRSAVGTYGLAYVRPFVRLSVCLFGRDLKIRS